MKDKDLKRFSANGNSFFLLDSRGKQDQDYSLRAKTLCRDKKIDGLLVLKESRIADVRMRIFNTDGSEAEMCGNGARVAAWVLIKEGSDNLVIETMAGLVEAKKAGAQAAIKLTDPSQINVNIPLEVSGRAIRVSFINTGVPHAVVFVNSLKRIDVEQIGRSLRFHQAFAPKGANVNFVEVVAPDTIHVRTYERGVEAETLACGTGAAASALIAFRLMFITSVSVDVVPTSKETLNVSFIYEDGKFYDVWLKGNVKEIR